MSIWRHVYMYYDVEDKLKWHRWFAWYPVKTTDNKWAWLKDVNRVEKIVKDIDGFAIIKIEYERIK